MNTPPRPVWRFKNSDFERCLALAVGADVSPFIAQLLINRGIETAPEARAYLDPAFEELHDPFRLGDMEKAVERINRAIKCGEKICIYGDYDADGTTATALLLHTFRELGFPADYYIPDRFDDGYGLSKNTIKKIREKKKTDLLISVDCGIKSVADVALANELGMDVIITDHHQPEDEAPPAYALISPKLDGNEYPYTELAGVGLAFKLAQALIDDRGFLESMLDLVALGTVADMAPLTGENRTLSRLGLMELEKRERPGVHALCEVAGHNIDTPLDGYAISFKLAPRINSAGRLDTAHKAVELLTTDSKDEAKRLAAALNDINQERQKLGREIEEMASAFIEKKVPDETVGVVVDSDEWDHKAKGVVGIVASRLMRTYHRPVIVLAIDGAEATGSGRCIDGMNLADALVACTDLLVKHGGHAAAAGLTIKTKDIPEFREAFDAYAREHLTETALQPRLDMEFETQFSTLTLDAMKALARLEPFGVENRAPVFGARRVKVVGKPSTMGKEKKHLQMRVSDGTAKIRAIEWQAAHRMITFTRPNMSLDIAFSPRINEWQGGRKVELTLRDVEVHAEGRNMNWDVFPRQEDESRVKLVDRRNVNKKNYLLKVLAREEPCIIYVQDEAMLDTLLAKLLPENLEGIARHTEATTTAETAALLQQLARGDIRAIASCGAFSEIEAFPFVKHTVFCHLTPSTRLFFQRCLPAFATDETSYLHLIYGDADIKATQACLRETYPTDAELRTLFGNLRETLTANGAAGYPEAEILNSGLGSLATLQTGLAVFEELAFIERHEQAGSQFVRLLPPQQNDLSRSRTYLRGELIKQSSPPFIQFQLKESIESMWERIEHEHQGLSQPDSSV